jgi:tetratricopeptide (TPR) repeat protein
VRRVLRAAAVFGETFSVNGVAALVEDAGIPAALEVLEAREVLLPRRNPAEGERAFRHALLREAAYDMLTDEDRQRAHRQAGEFLERRGDHNALVLVEHFERGGLPARAAGHCERAAAQALDANDLAGAVDLVARGVRNGAEGATLGALRLTEARARVCMGQPAEGESAAREALARCRGSVRLGAASELIGALGQQGRFAEIETLVEEIRGWPEVRGIPDDLAAWHSTLLRAAGYLPQGGRLALTEGLLAEVERGALPDHPDLDAMLHVARGLMLLGPQPAAAAGQFEQALAAFGRCANVRRSIETSGNIASALGSTGQLEEAERHLRAILRDVERMNLRFLEPIFRANLGMIRADLGALEEGRQIVEEALTISRRNADRRVEGFSQQYLAVIAIRLRHFDAAEVHARAALSLAGEALQPAAMAALACALLGEGRVPEALVEARQANHLLERAGYVEDGEALILLSLAESLLAAGDRVAGREAAGRAYRRLLDRADAIDEPSWRTSFLAALPEHRRTIEVARTLGLTGSA